MRIAQLAPTYERVPPHGYGGTELVVHLVTEALVRRGHEVTLFATGDSLTRARLEPTVPRPYRYGADDDGLRHAEYVHLANAQAAFRAAADGRFDLVHNHAGIEGLVLAAWSTTPVLTTTHGAWAPEAAAAWDAYPWRHHQLSAKQAGTYPMRGRLAPVHHGIDISRIAPRIEPDPDDAPLVFLGRFSPTKGPDVAIEVARRSGRRLLLAGKVDGGDREWYEATIAPRIDGDRIRLVGEVDEPAKATLLAGAAAMLFPIAWDEPFGLVVVEALAAGTPVVAFGRGSVPELVDHGRTGFVVDDVDAMVDAVGRIGALDRAACRAAAEDRFTVDRMIDDLLDRYRETIEAGPAGHVIGTSPAIAALG
jgi:glycosyltransferase involved in cell wall biosynthesis